MPAIKANEKTSLVITGQLVDEDGAGIPKFAFDVVFITIYLAGDRTKLIRSSDDLLADPGFVIDSEGNLTWNVRPFETQILNPRTPLGSSEKHAVYIEFGWNAPVVRQLAAPFATVAGSPIVTVTDPAHGLQVDDHVYFNAPDPVGGLDMGGIEIITAVLDADRYTFQHRTAAASTETGGGPTVVYCNGKSGSVEASMSIKRVDPV
jgi:hypothetical protein